MYGKISERIGFSPLRSNRNKKARCCNICGQSFKPQSAFERYCHHCKEEEEILKYSDWLPEVDGVLTARISA